MVIGVNGVTESLLTHYWSITGHWSLESPDRSLKWSIHGRLRIHSSSLQLRWTLLGLILDLRAILGRIHSQRNMARASGLGWIFHEGGGSTRGSPFRFWLGWIFCEAGMLGCSTQEIVGGWWWVGGGGWAQNSPKCTHE